MEQAKHYPYPRTDHVHGSAVVDDDGSKDVPKDWLSGKYRVVIQEKVDGTNVGVHFEEPWVPVPQKRSGLILQGEHEQYVRFRDFCFEHVEALWNALSTRYVLFGEWLLVQHGVVYDRLSSFFIAFDVLDKTDGSFLSTKAMAELLKDSGVETVPLLATAWNGTTKQLEELVKTSRFSTSETCEGVYIRFETDARCVERLKYRRKTFTAGRTDFATRVAYNKVKE
jgi:ATP-dependent RNA circularization protein (DNA/RNA ligase family)